MWPRRYLGVWADIGKEDAFRLSPNNRATPAMDSLDQPAHSASRTPAPGQIAIQPLGVIAAYGSQAFPLAAAFIALQVIVPTFYAENTSLSLTQIGALLLVARLCDMVTDPIVGYLSDRSSLRWGRRKSFMVIAAPLVAISVWFLFNPPLSAESVGAEREATVGALYLLAWTVAIYVAGTLSIVPFSAWGAELSNDYNQRSRINGVRVAFGLAGTLAALVVPAVMAREGSGQLGDTLSAIAWLVVLSLAATTLWAAQRVPDNASTTLPDRTVEAAWQMLKTANPFRQLLLSFLLNAVGNAIPATLFLLYVTHVLGVPGQAGALLFLYFIAAALAVPFWVRLSRRFGKHQTWAIAIVLACLFFLWTPMLDADRVFWFYVIVVATGFTTGADLALPAAINADVIEWDALETGYTRPGLFFALWGTATKLSYALAVGIAFPLLEFSGFSAGEVNDVEAIGALAFLYGAPCILFKLSSLWCMRGYPITAERHEQIVEELKRCNINQPSAQP